MLAVLTANYWIMVEINKVDWDFGLTWKDQSRRIFDLDFWRLDSNAFEVNSNHGVQGAASYLVGRSNGLTLAESFLLGVAASSVWELIVEFQEVVSLNDMIVTPIAGFSLGESLFQFSRYAHRPGTGWALRALSDILDPAGCVNRWLSGRRDRLDARAGWADARGEFSIAGGVSSGIKGTPAGPTIRIAMDSRFSDFTISGRHQTAYSGLCADLEFSKSGFSRFSATSRVLFWNWFRSRNVAGGAAGTSGSAGSRFILGLASGLDFASLAYRGFYDRFITVDGLGLMARWAAKTAAGGEFALSAEAYGSFSAARPAALDAYRIRDDLFYAKTSLRVWEYYWALGYSLVLGAEWRGKGLEARGEIRHHALDSIEGRDRFPSSVARDFDLTDHRTIWTLRLSVPLGDRGVGLFAGIEGYHRCGTMMGVRDAGRLFDLMAGARFAF